ncbi:hypothetical protein Agabi119p4_4100 [Agaricus bisporus var. burnettii]|uniref:Velvet domain-containing protein n=1 Tax=Agaricus bisporus var. burnettii TaxID=192524 RepID=A0A8H7F2P5_AGABI|nr:hypothetical protein Agabi119p4_4100 [Agaricus bisporus var. burnettii]
MIQQTNRQPRRSPPAQPDSEPASPSDCPEIWSQTLGNKHYSLEVVQHPLRARMCGFGDKDRRPLAPAAVVKMVVRHQDDSVVDVDEIDWSFFLVTVDLWSADAKQEMNLVLHPSSTDRYMPAPSSKNRRRGTSTHQPSNPQTPVQPSHAPSYRPPEQALPTYHQGYFSSATTPSDHGGNTYTGATNPIPNPYTAPPHQSDPPNWGYPTSAAVDRSTTYPPPALPSIHTFPANSNQPNSWVNPDVYHPLDPSNEKSHDPNAAYASTSYQSIQVSPSNSQSGQPQHQYYPSPTTTSGPSHNTTANNNSHSDKNPAAVNPPITTSYPPMPSPRLAYTRTLVGPLSANACRLQDEHRKPGIFFLFQDLSVRTEGTFRLRLRLMNVGAPPAPEYGATKVHNDVSPVLAQTFTDPFTVFSAKRFPGVPDTTALSIAFGNQGQKIPLRNRHGPAKRRRPNSSSAEEDDSDED